MMDRALAEASRWDEPELGEKCGSPRVRMRRTLGRISHGAGYRSRGPLGTLRPQPGIGEIILSAIASSRRRAEEGD